MVSLQHSSPTDWDGQINLNDDETSDEGKHLENINFAFNLLFEFFWKKRCCLEAAIDAMLAATRASRLNSRGGETERLPPTSQLSRLAHFSQPKQYNVFFKIFFYVYFDSSNNVFPIERQFILRAAIRSISA